MKLLFFSGNLCGGGAERVLVNLTNELARRGHDVTISLNTNKVDYQLDERVKIYAAPLKQWYKGRNIVKRLWRNLMMARHRRVQTRNAIRDIRPDVIITFLQCNMLPIIRYHGDIPIVHSEHNAYDRKNGIQRYFNRFYLNRFFDLVCVLTPFDQGFAKAKGLSNTVVMPNPNTFEPISIEQCRVLFDKRKNIMFCGRLDDWHVKGLDVALSAFKQIVDKIPHVDLDIVGSGEEKTVNLIKQMAYRLNIADRIHFLGQCSNVDEIMRQHQLLFLSSRSEGFPMVVTEAMTQGLPCVAFEHLASSIILNGLDGVLVKDNNVAELSNAILSVINDDTKRKLFGEESVKNVTRFSPNNIADKWEAALSQIINEDK